MTHSFPTRRSSDLPDAGRGGGEQHLALRSRRAARRARGPANGGARMNGLFLIAEIGGRAVAISADQIESVVDIGVVTPIPLADAGVRGLAALRSRVVTVINSCVALGLPCPGDAARRAVITHIDGHPYAMLVEGVEDVEIGRAHV